MESCFDSGWCFLLVGGVLLLLRTEPRSFFCCGVDLERGSWMRLSRRFVYWRRVDERWRVRSDGGMSRISTAELSTESKTHLYFVKTLAFLLKNAIQPIHVQHTCTCMLILITVYQIQMPWESVVYRRWRYWWRLAGTPVVSWPLLCSHWPG